MTLNQLREWWRLDRERRTESTKEVDDKDLAKLIGASNANVNSRLPDDQNTRLLHLQADITWLSLQG